MCIACLVLLSGCSENKEISNHTTNPTSVPAPISLATDAPTSNEAISSNYSSSSYSSSSYSSSSQKTKKCLECGAPIYDDETWCDDCLFGSLDSGGNDDYSSRYDDYDYDDYDYSDFSADYDKDGNYKPVESMTSEEILEELKSYFDD